MGIPERRSLAASVGWMFQGERARRDLSQSQAARRLGVSQQWVSKVERGAAVLTTQAIERLFAIFDLQVRVDVEPAGADLDGEIDAAEALTEAQREELVGGFGRTFDRLRALPWVVTGRLGALLQGAPLRALWLDLVVAEQDLDTLAAIFEREVCERWNVRLHDYYGEPLHPRAPGSNRWMLGTCEVRLEVVQRLPTAITVVVGDRRVPVLPLAEIEGSYADIARLMQRARTRVIHRQL
jgi:transcriptional regulator with XRE-family HTH domain